MGYTQGMPTWQPPEYLADPPPQSRWRAAVAQALFSLGAARMTEWLAHTVEFCRMPEGEAPRMRPVMHSRSAILCYHRIGRGGVPVYSGLPTSLFEAQMAYLRRHYRILSLDGLLGEIAVPRKGRPAVAISFDDGYADLYTQAFPILQRYEIPATIFLTVGAIESGEVAWYDRVFVAFQVAPPMDLVLPLKPPRRILLGTPEERLNAAVEFISLLRKLPAREQSACCAQLEEAVEIPHESVVNRMLNWKQIREMQSAGVSFGTHTMTHPVVSRLDAKDLEWELGESKRILEERVEQPVLDFAFPFGKPEECSDSAVKCLGRLGYRSAATTVEGFNDPATAPFLLRRVSFGEERSLAMFALKLSKLFLFPETLPSSARSSAVLEGSREAAAKPGAAFS
jgi:peptidoglycan/xylan/chitin deacetylase (PgdA/CDA1 family)